MHQTISATSSNAESLRGIATDDITPDEPTLIDNVASYPTPEGLLLSLTPAGVLPRVSAWLIDSLIRIVIYMSVVFVFNFFGEAGYGFIAIGIFLITWLYPVYFEVYRSGMTPGKKSQGIYVCHDDGTPITLSASMIRNLLRVADFLPFMYLVGVFSVLFNRKSQRIGDMVAGTMVVYGEQDEVAGLFRKVYGVTAGKSLADQLTATNQKLANLSANRAVSVTSVPLFTFPLQLHEQQALLSFAERAWFLSDARQLEIVHHLSPLLSHTVRQTGTANYSSSKLPALKPLPDDVMLLAVYKRIEGIVGNQSLANSHNPSHNLPTNSATMGEGNS